MRPKVSFYAPLSYCYLAIYYFIWDMLYNIFLFFFLPTTLDELNQRGYRRISPLRMCLIKPSNQYGPLTLIILQQLCVLFEEKQVKMN